MKLSLRWLQRHVDLSGIEPQQILADLTMSTAEIEGIHLFGAGLEPLLVGEVLQRERHPDADKLSVCRVALGPGRVVQIVCGAPNVERGQKVVVIEPGHALPAAGGKGALKIKPAKIRGVDSHGMICSAQELALGTDHDGILVLPSGSAVGARLVDVLPCLDHVLEIDNKSINHRPDLWGHYGFARELAAIYGRPLRALGAPVALPAQGRGVAIEVQDRLACPRYCGLLVGNVTAGPSPFELRLLLAAVGQRAINLPVDLTNFVMLDLGQPMHAFDAAHLGDRPIRVRRARSGEPLTTLDGMARALTADDLLICGGDRPEALAGIMGGAGTMVGEGTRTLFLESANFHAATIRRTSMRLGLRTDASARFEKAQDPANAELAVHHFVRLLQTWGSGTPLGPLGDPLPFRPTTKTIALRRARLQQKLGVALPGARVRTILESLQFGVAEAADAFAVTVPTFRATKDIAIEDDLVEEVGRMFRYDNIPEQPLQSVVVPPCREEELFVIRRMGEVAALDLFANELYDYTFTHDALLAQVGALAHAYVRVRNPVAPEITRVRRHVLPSVLGNVAENLRRESEVVLFEQGKGYHPDVRDADGLPREVREFALVWSRRNGAHPYAELREAVSHLLERVGYAGDLVREWRGSDQPWVHPNAAVAIDRDGSPCGYVAHLHPACARALGIPGTTAIACIDVRSMLGAGRAAVAYRSLPAFPALAVDVALLVPETTRVAAVVQFLRQAGRKLVREVRWFEVHRGQGVPSGKKSLNFTVTLGADDRTLDDQDEARFIQKVRDQAGEIGAELRG